MTTLHLVLPEPPSANRYWRHVGRNVVLSAEAKAYRDTVFNAYLTANRHQRIAFPTQAVEVRLEWHRGAKRGDLDNRIKQVLDSLRGLAYKDDKQIAAITAVRYEAPKQGKLLVWVDLYEVATP